MEKRDVKGFYYVCQGRRQPCASRYRLIIENSKWHECLDRAVHTTPLNAGRRAGARQLVGTIW
jgi:hypothetical protein